MKSIFSYCKSACGGACLDESGVPSPPTAFFPLNLEQCRSASGTLVRAVQRSQAEERRAGGLSDLLKRLRRSRWISGAGPGSEERARWETRGDSLSCRALDETRSGRWEPHRLGCREASVGQGAGEHTRQAGGGGIDLDLYMWLEQMPPTALPLLPLLRLDLLLLGLPGMELLVLAFIRGYIARYAAYLDAYTGPGTATDSLGGKESSKDGNWHCFRGKSKPTPNKLLDRSRTFSIRPPAAEGVRFPLYAMWRKRLIQRDMPALPALRFQTCRLLSGNVRNRELTIIQRRILRRLRKKKRSIKRKIYPRKNLNSYIQSQTTRKLPLFHGDLPITEMHRGTEQTSYIPFPLNPETRLDVIPVRLHFRETIPQARQPISHRRVCVNNGMGPLKGGGEASRTSDRPRHINHSRRRERFEIPEGRRTMILSVLSSLALVSGLMVARAKNPVHSVLFPIPVFRDTSGLLLLLGLDFSAMIFPVVHIGAIAVSFLFVVMMFHIQIAEIHEEVLRYLPVVYGLLTATNTLETTGPYGATPLRSEAIPARANWVFALTQKDNIRYRKDFLQEHRRTTYIKDGCTKSGKVGALKVCVLAAAGSFGLGQPRELINQYVRSESMRRLQITALLEAIRQERA
uniref:Uncharacterized protein n=1 Tax=Acer yangbiense TaxID=1000413 RepID=A0A5C7GQ79_9ROSI